MIFTNKQYTVKVNYYILLNLAFNPYIEPQITYWSSSKVYHKNKKKRNKKEKWNKHLVWERERERVMVFNATFNNIQVRSWRSVETGVLRENHWPAESDRQTLLHYVVSSTSRLSGIQIMLVVIGTNCIGTVKSLLFVWYQFLWFSWVGWHTKLRIQWTMKLGKQFDIDI
jgi:hypothetical protein